MSAMLDTYDMQMLDYSGDLDVQMHPSSSDAWFQDEAKMEEDGPPLIKHESDDHLKTDAYTHEKVDGTIEVDMEPTLDLHNTEYDMLDDEEIHSGEILDIEVYDASHVQSPAMFALDSEQGESFQQPFETLDSGSTLNDTVPAVPLGPLNPPLESSDTHTIPSDEFPSASEIFVQPPVFETASEEQPAVDSLEPATELANTGVDPSLEFLATEAHEAPIESGEIYVQDSEGPATKPTAVATESLEESHESEVDGPPTHVQSYDNGAHGSVVPTDVHDALETVVIPDDNASSGDPHEISEGVYIDPPPPVLLSVGSDDGFDFSFFNEPSVWNEGAEKDTDVKHLTHILLHNLPTLYYEPLSTVFEALHQEEIVHSLFPTADTELVLEAVDLRLTLSEDNIYAREVTLHDLNVLHDVSGISGLLRMRLFTSTTPRFITRYQHLQDQVSRLDLGLLAEGLSVNPNADDVPPHEEQHEASELPREYEGAQDQTTHKQNEQSIHGEEDQTVEEVEGDESHLQGHIHQHYEEEQVSEPILNLQEQTEELHADDEPNSLNEQNTAEETGANHPLLTQDDSSSSQHLADCNEKDDESQTPTHHSTPTSGSRDIGESVHEDDDTGVIALEAVEAHLHDAEYAEDVHPFDAEYKGEHQYLEYDVEEDQGEFGEEEHQEEDQRRQPQGQIYEEGEESEHQQSAEEPQLDQSESYHEIQGSEEVDQLPPPTTDELEQLISAGTPEPENASIYEQTSAIGEGAHYSEGDYLDDVGAAFNGYAPTEPNNEPSSAEKAEQIPDVAADPPDPHPEIPEFVGEEWEDDLDGEGEIDDTWDEDNEVEAAQSNSNNSSITLSSKASKRSHDELESDGNGDEEGDSHHWTPPGSPGPKRSRTH